MMESTHDRSQIRYRTYSARSSIPPHVHPWSSMTLVVGGSYEERIVGWAAEHHTDSVLMYPANLPHAQAFGRLGARKIVVTPSPALLDYLQTAISFASAPFTQSTLIGNLARQIDAERLLGDDYSDAAIEGALWQIAAMIGRDMAGATGPCSSIASRVHRLLLETNGEVVSVAALSRETDCHPATLTRAFRREFGCSPGRYQRRLRIDQAALLLRDTATPLAEVAAACGFCDQSHLARSFRAVLGCTPSEYRRRA